MAERTVRAKSFQSQGKFVPRCCITEVEATLAVPQSGGEYREEACEQGCAGADRSGVWLA
jgi:hypothetical protein